MLANCLVRADCPPELSSMRDNARFRAYQEALDAAIFILGGQGDVEDALLAAEEKMQATYNGSFFAYAWQKDAAIANDLAKIKRALDAVFSENETVIDSKVRVSLKTPSLYDGSVEHTVDLILQRVSGNMVAVNFHLGKGTRGSKCRTKEGLPWYDPVTVVTKGALEQEYPGITVWDVFLQNEKDTADTVFPEFDSRDLRTGQIKVNTYANNSQVNFYEEGIWDEEGFMRFAKEAFLNPGKTACELCEQAYLCRNGIPRLSPVYDLEEMPEKKPYQLPEFSKEQEQIIRHVNGPFLVVAGPGSGKTATLVGRIKYLVEECGVPPEFILAITFTNKAAGEIKERCGSLESEIDCCTLNALGYRILMNHAKEAGIDRYRLLTKDISSQIIDDLLHDMAKPLQGFSYSVKHGSKGLISTVRSRMEEYLADPANTREKYQLGNDFDAFVDRYQQTVKAGGYIDFRQQITLCVKLLEEHEEIRKAYQRMYWQICVDEYQDIDAEQCRFIDILAAGRHNLMLIGDDDQSIYEWRGASPSFMINFRQRYPEGDVFFLSKNYRCTEDIVKMAASNFMGEVVRFDKEIVSVKGPGAPVVISQGENYWEQAGSVIRELLSDGVRPDDIAVLAWNHKTLQETCSKLPDLPLKLEGELFSRSAFFTFVKDVLILAENVESEAARWEYFSLFGLPKPSLITFKETLLATDAAFPYVEVGNENCAYMCLKALLRVIDNGYDAKSFIKKAADISGYRLQKVYDQMLEEMIKQRNTSTCAELRRNMAMMVDAGEDKKLEADYPGQVMLSTVHVAKGKEWKNVIILDDFGENDSPSVRRLIYVALTRAEDKLFIAKLADKRSLLLPAE